MYTTTTLRRPPESVSFALKMAAAALRLHCSAAFVPPFPLRKPREVADSHVEFPFNVNHFPLVRQDAHY